MVVPFGAGSRAGVCALAAGARPATRHGTSASLLFMSLLLFVTFPTGADGSVRWRGTIERTRQRPGEARPAPAVLNLRRAEPLSRPVAVLAVFATWRRSSSTTGSCAGTSGAAVGRDGSASVGPHGARRRAAGPRSWASCGRGSRACSRGAGAYWGRSSVRALPAVRDAARLGVHGPPAPRRRVRPAGRRARRAGPGVSTTTAKGIAIVEAFLAAPSVRRRGLALAGRVGRRVADDRTITRVSSSSREFARPSPPAAHLREYVGVSPKWVIQRYRLLDAAERVASGPSWTGPTWRSTSATRTRPTSSATSSAWSAARPRVRQEPLIPRTAAPGPARRRSARSRSSGARRRSA